MLFGSTILVMAVWAKADPLTVSKVLSLSKVTVAKLVEALNAASPI